jgi:hypothetical protein
VAQVKFPRRAGFSIIRRTFSNYPARAGFPGNSFLVGHQEKGLALNVRGDLAPSLFKALHGLKGSSEELGHLFLGFLESLAQGTELFGIQGLSFS